MPEITKTPLKASRAKCLDCCAGQINEVRQCPCMDCPLYPYRFGKNPNRAGMVNKGSFPQKSTAQQAAKPLAPAPEGTYTTQPTEAQKGGAG